jgi:transcriptional regulator with PAS, ATPase and Fis domain
MCRLMAQMAAAAQTTLDVMLIGETGTGKELFARAVHASGPTAGGPFVAINCAAIPSELLEAEFFGVQRRVATGVDPRIGLFVQADGGSIFLDEVGELPERLQSKLLRVFDQREVLPLGASTPRRIAVRVISASNRPLDGHLRPDLFFRLRGIEFRIPPLRERREDIPALVTVLMARACEESRKTIRGISRSALRHLVEHEWPGNVRELKNEVRRAVLVAPAGGVLQPEHFTFAPTPSASAASVAAASTAASPPPSTLAEAERAAIENALATAGGNQSLAARLLGITRNGLAAKLKRLGLR